MSETDQTLSLVSLWVAGGRRLRAWAAFALHTSCCAVKPCQLSTSSVLMSSIQVCSLGAQKRCPIWLWSDTPCRCTCPPAKSHAQYRSSVPRADSPAPRMRARVSATFVTFRARLQRGKGGGWYVVTANIGNIRGAGRGEAVTGVNRGLPRRRPGSKLSFAARTQPGRLSRSLRAASATPGVTRPAPGRTALLGVGGATLGRSICTPPPVR